MTAPHRMTAQQAARWIGVDDDGEPLVSAASVLRAVRRGELRATKVAGRVLISSTDLDAWLDGAVVSGGE